MRLNRFLDVMIAVFLLSTSLLVNVMKADDTIDSRVDAYFDIEFVTGTVLHINIVMDVYKLTIDKTYNADDIKIASDQEMGALRYELYLLLKNQLAEIFKEAEISNFSMPIYDGERFNEILNVKLTASFFNLRDSFSFWDILIGFIYTGVLLFLIYLLSKDIREPKVI